MIAVHYLVFQYGLRSGEVKTEAFRSKNQYFSPLSTYHRHLFGRLIHIVQVFLITWMQKLGRFRTGHRRYIGKRNRQKRITLTKRAVKPLPLGIRI